MNKSNSFVFNHLSLIATIIVYLFTVIIHIISDSFIFGDQLGLLIIFIPFYLLGYSLDYLIKNNSSVNKILAVVAKLLPLIIILLWLPNSYLMINYYDKSIVQKYFYYIGYVVWLLLAVPFFIASHGKGSFRQKTIRSLTGTAAFAVIYIMLTTKTDYLDKKAGFAIIVLSYFFIFHAASGISKFNYAAPVLGAINAVTLFIFYKFPGKGAGFNMDSTINLKIDVLMLITFVICMIIRIYGTFSENKNSAKSK